MKLKDLMETMDVNSGIWKTKDHEPIEWSEWDGCYQIGYDYSRPLTEAQVIELEVVAIRPRTSYDFIIELDV